MIDIATIIIRSANERTEQLCRKLILEQGVEQKNVFVVREVPFSASLYKSFEAGINNDLPWTFCVDADVLLRPGSIRYILDIAHKQKGDTFGLQCMVMDKFFGGPRSAGNHLYRTSFLEKVVTKIPAEGITIRPERYTISNMQKDGFRWRKIPYIIGIHDDEQYNYDIYRKCFVHGVKHLDLASMLKEIWNSNSKYDYDYTIALKAFADSILNTNPVYINSEHKLFKDLFNKTGFSEKGQIDVMAYSLSTVEKKIINWEFHDAYLRWFPARWGPYKKESLFNKINRNIKHDGIARTLYKNFGKVLIYFGETITRKGNTNNGSL